LARIVFGQRDAVRGRSGRLAKTTVSAGNSTAASVGPVSRTIQKVEAAARTRTARRMRKIFFIGDFDAAVIEAAS
jgi:hypothetical protein